MIKKAAKQLSKNVGTNLVGIIADLTVTYDVIITDGFQGVDMGYNTAILHGTVLCLTLADSVGRITMGKGFDDGIRKIYAECKIYKKEYEKNHDKK